jgi:hypothetical protein
MRCIGNLTWMLALVVLAAMSSGGQARVLLEDQARRVAERVQRDVQQQLRRVSGFDCLVGAR